MKRFSASILLKIPSMVTGITIVFVHIISTYPSQGEKNTYRPADHARQVLQFIQHLIMALPGNKTCARRYMIAGNHEFHQLSQAFKKNFAGNQLRLKRVLAEKLLFIERRMSGLICIGNISPDNKILV